MIKADLLVNLEESKELISILYIDEVKQLAFTVNERKEFMIKTLQEIEDDIENRYQIYNSKFIHKRIKEEVGK